ncbi:hypothetical protein RB195_019717 [Necator americanus]|uniref:Reverse transcriptase domain-containing protein n=1 Tax=Necator americanus TaxID=51031 RepID=A0ABR1CH24_NECAM
MVIEGRLEYRPLLVLASVDYERAFDSVETNAILSALVDQDDLKEELNRRMTVTWAAFAPVREATDHVTDQDLRAHLFDSTVLPGLCYAAET